MKNFKVKFFGSKNKREQVKQVKTTVEAKSVEDVEEVIRHKLGYVVINSLKIHPIEE